MCTCTTVVFDESIYSSFVFSFTLGCSCDLFPAPFFGISFLVELVVPLFADEVVQVVGHGVVALGERQTRQDPRGSLALPVATNAAVTFVQTNGALPVGVFECFPRVLAVPVFEADPTECTPDSMAET